MYVGMCQQLIERVMKKYGIRRLADPDEWIIRLQGGRLDHWGPFVESALFETKEQAEIQARLRFCGPWQKYAYVDEVEL